jgi:hypothetical protein
MRFHSLPTIMARFKIRARSSIRGSFTGMRIMCNLLSTTQFEMPLSNGWLDGKFALRQLRTVM